MDAQRLARLGRGCPNRDSQRRNKPAGRSTWEGPGRHQRQQRPDPGALRNTFGGRGQEKGQDSDRGESRGGVPLGERVRNPSGLSLALGCSLGLSGFPFQGLRPQRNRPSGSSALAVRARGVWPWSPEDQSCDHGAPGGGAPGSGAHRRLPRVKLITGPVAGRGSPILDFGRSSPPPRTQLSAGHAAPPGSPLPLLCY